MVEGTKKGGVIIYLQQHLVWLVILTLIILPMACKFYFKKKENYTEVHNKANQIPLLEQRVKVLEEKCKE